MFLFFHRISIFSIKMKDKIHRWEVTIRTCSRFYLFIFYYARSVPGYITQAKKIIYCSTRLSQVVQYTAVSARHLGFLEYFAVSCYQADSSVICTFVCVCERIAAEHAVLEPLLSTCCLSQSQPCTDRRLSQICTKIHSPVCSLSDIQLSLSLRWSVRKPFSARSCNLIFFLSFSFADFLPTAKP